MNWYLLALGIAFIIAGLLWPSLKRRHLFHLAGDIFIGRPGFKFMFPITTMLIEGHTDGKGAHAYNMKLSDNHAASVKSSLV